MTDVTRTIMDVDFVKLYASIVTSSVWLEDDATLRVWIYMLATADENGYVGASVGGLAHQARVTKEQCRKALDIFLAPDEDSRDRLAHPERDGRKIEVVEGGWVVLNIPDYREKRTRKQVADAERQRRFRERDMSRGNAVTDERNGVTDVTERDSHTLSQNLTDERDVSHMSHDVAAEGEGEVTTTTPPPHPRARETSLDNLPAEFADDVEAFLKLWPPVGRRAAESEINAMLAGMAGHGPKVSDQQMGQAIRDYVAAGVTRPSLKHFRRFVSSTLEEGKPRPAPLRRTRGMTGAAQMLVELIRKRRNPQFPNSIPANWNEGINERVQGIVKPFLPRIMADDIKGDGMLVAQLRQAMEEGADE